MNKIIINGNGIFIRTLSKMRVYYSMSHNFGTYNTPEDALFFVFDVPNDKYYSI